MKGIQINNYFNNHITLNGKKVNQESRPVLESAKKQHFNHNLPQVESHILEGKGNPTKSSQLAPKKRNNTLNQVKKSTGPKRSISVDRQRNAISAKKKDETISQGSDKEDEHVVNMSQRKLKPHANKGGLGKRSKSTIIKPGHLDINKQLVKKQNKKISSNHTDQSMKVKTKRKKSARTIDHSKELKKEVKAPLTSRRQFLPISSRQVPKKQKLTLRLDRTEVKDEKKSSLSQLKNKISSSKRKLSKPASAREKKPSRKARLLQEWKDRYENQMILEGDNSNRMRNSEQATDSDFLSVMSNLEKVLTSVGSKQKLKKQLDLINEKLKEFRIDSQSQNSQLFDENRQVQIKRNHEPLRIEDQFDQREASYQKHENNSEEDSQQPYRQKVEQMVNYLEEQTYKKEIDGCNPMVGKRSHNGFIFGVDAFNAEVNHEEEERKKEIQLLKSFKESSTNMMKKVGLTNPETHSVEPWMDDFKQKCQEQQKEELKVEEVIEKQDKSEQKSNKVQLILNNESNVSSSSSTNLANILKQQKYPFNPKSPKFQDIQLNNFIMMKQQFLSSKHSKMSELVKTMYEKQLVSPRSYENQVRSIDQKMRDQSLAIEFLKKQAEQFSSIISEINKDKNAIKDIQELIRMEKWDEAKLLVKIQEKPAEEILENQQQQALEDENINNFHVHKRQKFDPHEEQGWQLVQVKEGEQEGKVNSNQFIDIGEMTNRGRRKAQARIDLEQECGGTDESIVLDEQVDPDMNSEDGIIFYPENNNTDDNMVDGGLLKLVPVVHHEGQQNISSQQPMILSTNDNVIQIDCEDMGSKSFDASAIQRNYSNVSGVSSQSDRKGFTTNLYFIKEYCIALCQFVRDNDIFKAQFKNNISKTLQFDLPAVLKDLSCENQTEYLYAKRKSKVAISELVWNEFNAQYESLKYISNFGKTGERYTFEKEQEIIFLRMIYEVLNQSLDSERPGSHFGKAFPWKDDAKHLKNLRQISQPEKDNIQAYDLMFGVAIARIIQWGSCLCGFLPDTVQLQNTQIDEPYVNHIRQTRMAFLLQKMMAAQESMMTNFQMQQTQIEHTVAKMIMSELMHEATSQIQEAMKGVEV